MGSRSRDRRSPATIRLLSCGTSPAARSAPSSSLTPSPAAMRHPEPYIGSEAQLLYWLKTTSANLTFTGDPIPGITGPEGLTPRGALATTVVYCSVRNGNTCEGPCTVYNGDPECLHAPNTNCLFATGEVTFCAPDKCDCPCNLYSHCGTRMDGGFCWTPGTNAIYVGGLFPG